MPKLPEFEFNLDEKEILFFGTYIPTQLGPRILMSYFMAIFMRSDSNDRFPTSEKPDVNIVTNGTFLFPTSSKMAGQS